VDRGAGHLEDERLIHADPAHLQLGRRARLAAQLFHRLVVLPALGRAAVERDDLVARLNTGPLGRRLRQGRDHGDPAVAHIDLDAQAAVVPGGLLGEEPEVVRLQEHGVRVVQLVQQAVDRHLVEPSLVERVDVVVGHVRQHVLEQACLLIDGSRGSRLPLQQPAAGRERDHGDAGDDGQLANVHDMPRVESAAAAVTSRHAASCTACRDRDASTCTTPGPCARRYASRTRA